MTKEQFQKLPQAEQDALNEKWRRWWKKRKPKDGFSGLEHEAAMREFLSEQISSEEKCSACGDVCVPGTDLCSRCLHEYEKKVQS